MRKRAKACWRLYPWVCGAVLVAAGWWVAYRWSQTQLDRALFEAISRGEAAGVAGALRRGADPNTREDVRQPAASVDGARRLLLGGGGDTGTTALMEAAWQGDTEVAGLLIASGANVNARTGLGITALMCAAMAGNLPMARVLLAHGADPGARDLYGRRAAEMVSTRSPEWGRLLGLHTAGP